MDWLQISVTAIKENADEIETKLLELGANSVTLQDAEDKPILEPDIGTTPIWENSIITGLFQKPADQKKLLDSLNNNLPDHCILHVEELADRDWTRAWMDDYHAMQFGQRLWVCPRHTDPPSPDAVNLRLDPGLAFGTGTHPTTALCLRWLDENVDRPIEVLDYGCGTGILAIASILLGAKHADGVDIDEQAIEATKENAKDNSVDQDIDVWMTEEYESSCSSLKYDLVIANILSGPLMELAPYLCSKIKEGGHIVLSGILLEQAPEVSACYARFLDMNEYKSDGDWALLSGVKALQEE